MVRVLQLCSIHSPWNWWNRQPNRQLLLRQQGGLFGTANLLEQSQQRLQHLPGLLRAGWQSFRIENDYQAKKATHERIYWSRCKNLYFFDWQPGRTHLLRNCPGRQLDQPSGCPQRPSRFSRRWNLVRLQVCNHFKTHSIKKHFSDTINGLYVQQHNDTTSVFQHIYDSKYPLRVLIYNGDVDQACNFLGDQWFTEAFVKSNSIPVTKARADWRYMTQIAGYAKKFDTQNGFSIDLVTVKGAGHLVPTDRPGPALQMIANFFRNQDYSNPTVIDTSLHPLKNTYVVAEQLTASLNRSTTGFAHNGNRVHTKVHKVNRVSKYDQTGEKNIKTPAQRDAPPPPPTQTKDQDKITNLPGLTYTPNFNQYSGYLNASPGNYLHYWLVESQLNATYDPLILWLNGGPGCSSIGGFLEELGPFHVNSDGQTLFENTFSWNKAGNVLFLEAPRDVGYSYRSNEFPADPMYNDTYVWVWTEISVFALLVFRPLWTLFLLWPTSSTNSQSTKTATSTSLESRTEESTFQLLPALSSMPFR